MMGMPSRLLFWVSAIVCIALLVVVLQFFRDPKRKLVIHPDYIIAPADGKVVVIEETDEPEFMKGKCIQVSIFMSPVNVHINRFPVSGKVDYVKYHPGLYLVAWHPKSSTENERSSIGMVAPGGKLLMRQIAGALARRIVYYAKEGEEGTQGSQFGFIKFGSRVDLFLPPETLICVKLGDKVSGGISKIAEWKR